MENWKDPASADLVSTFAIITTDANELVAEIHDRMPLILAPADYNRWLRDDRDPHELMRVFRPSQCGCGRSRRGSTSRRTTIPRSLSRSNWPRLLHRKPRQLCIRTISLCDLPLP
jgi:putative SOS response-associated peptidase YedK